MEHNNELSSSDDDDCRLVLGPQIGRKLKRPVKPRTGRDIKKPRNDFNEIVSCLGNNKEFEPKPPNFDVFEISDINELLGIAPLSESWSSTEFDEDQEETTCLVEDCRHNKSSNGEENNNTTTKNGITNQKNSETLVNTKPSTSKTNVPEPSTEFKVPNPVGPLRSQPVKQNSNKKKEQPSASTSQSKTSRNQHVIPTKIAGNSTTNNARLSEPSTSNSTASLKSLQSNTSSSKKSTLSIEAVSTNSKLTEDNLSEKSQDSSNMSVSSSNSRKMRKRRKKSRRKNASDNSVTTSNKSNASTDSNNSNATSSKLEVIVISSDGTESESNVNKISKVMLANAVVEAEMNVMNENVNNSVRKLTIGFVKLFTKNAEEIDILEEDDDTFTASGRFEVKNQLKRRKYADGTSGLELHMTILTTIFSSPNSKHDHTESEDLNNDQKIIDECHNYSRKRRDSKDSSKEKKDYKNDRKDNEEFKNALNKNKDFKNSRKKDENSKNSQKYCENFKNKGKKTKGKKNKASETHNNNQISFNNNKINKRTNNSQNLIKSALNNRTINRESNKNQNIKEHKKIHEQQNNKQKSKQNYNYENRKYVDPNQPSTSRNYDPSCVLAVPSTSKCNNLQLIQNSGSSEISENIVDLDTSIGSEIPVMEEETLTVEDLAVPGCSNELAKAEQRQAFQQIKSAIGAWIKQCIDNVPIKKPPHVRDIMHEKVLRALSKKLRLLYNNCYDILRNKKILIIVPVSEDPNSDNFKPIITLSANSRIEHLMLDVSDTSSEESVNERDLPVPSDTDVADTEQSWSKNTEANSVQSISSDEFNFANQSINCDIDSSSEENCASSRETLGEDVIMPKTYRNLLDSSKERIDGTLSYMKKKEQNRLIEAQYQSDNDDSSSVSSNEEYRLYRNLHNERLNKQSDDCFSDEEIFCKSEKSNVSKAKYDNDQISSLIKFVEKRNSSESDCSSEEQFPYEADIDEVNSSGTEEEDDATSSTSNEDVEYSSSDVYYVRNDTEDDDECKSQQLSSNKEDNEIQNENENDQESGSVEENNILVDLTCTPPALDHRSNVSENRYIDIKILDALERERNKAILLHPSQVIHGSYDTVSNDSDVSINTQYERICDGITQPNFDTTTTDEIDVSSNNDDQISNEHEHNCCIPGIIGNVIDLVTKGFSNFTQVTDTIQPIENSAQTPTTEFQNGPVFTQTENVPLNYSLNSSCNSTNTSSTSSNQVSVISRNPLSIESNSRSPEPPIYCNPLESANIFTPSYMAEEYPVHHSSPIRYSHNSSIIQHILNPQNISNEPTLQDCLSRNGPSSSALRSGMRSSNRNIVPAHEDSERITASTQTSPNFVAIPNSQQSTSTEISSRSRTESLNSGIGQSEVESNVSNSLSGEALLSGDHCRACDSENLNASNSNSYAMNLIQTREFLQARRRRFLEVIEDLRARQFVFERSTMRDSHRNLWLRQQHQSETMRRHAVQRLASSANHSVTSPTTLESPESATSSSADISSSLEQLSGLMPFVTQTPEEDASTPAPNPPIQMPEFSEFHRMSFQERNRTLQSAIGSIHTAIRRFRPPILNLRNPLNTIDFRVSLRQAHREENQNPLVEHPPIVIEDDDDDDGEPAAPEASDYSISLETFNPHRIFQGNSGQIPLRDGQHDLLFHAMQNITHMEGVTGDDDLDLEDDEDPNDISMPLQQLIDSTTVLFEFDESSQEERCNICLSDYIIKEVLRRLPCFHTYHRNCIDEWLNRERRTCPNCRTYLSSHLCFADESK